MLKIGLIFIKRLMRRLSLSRGKYGGIGIVLAARNYLTGLYYYLVPWIVLLPTIDCIFSYNNIKVIVMLILWR